MNNALGLVWSSGTIPTYVGAPIAGWIASRRDRVRRRCLPLHHRSIAILSVVMLAAGLPVWLFVVPPQGTSDQVWLIVFYPAFGSVFAAVGFLSAALVPGEERSSRVHVAVLVAFLIVGMAAELLVVIYAMAGPRYDLNDYPLRSRLLARAVPLSVFQVGFVGALHLGLAHSADARGRALDRGPDES